MGGWWRWALVSPDGVAPSRMVGVSVSVNLPLHHKVQKFSSGTGSPGWSRRKGHKTVVAVGGGIFFATRHYPGTRTQKITGYVHATFVQLTLADSVLIIVCTCAAAQNLYRIEK